MTLQAETKYFYFHTVTGERREAITPDRVNINLFNTITDNIPTRLAYLNPGMSRDDIHEFLDLKNPKKKETYGSHKDREVLHFAIDSSVITYARYDLSKQELVLRFENDRDYMYFDVPSAVLCNFLNAPSKGVFFNANIRDKFKTAKFVS